MKATAATRMCAVMIIFRLAPELNMSSSLDQCAAEARVESASVHVYSGIDAHSQVPHSLKRQHLAQFLHGFQELVPCSNSVAHGRTLFRRTLTHPPEYYH